MDFNKYLKNLKWVINLINSPIRSMYKTTFLFKLVGDITYALGKDMHSTFVNLLKSYKVLGRILDGTVEEFYKNRNRLWFKKFFIEDELHELIKNDLEDLYPKYKHIKLTITKRGVLIYDNHKKNCSNILLMTIHSGTWIDESFASKQFPDRRTRYLEEDIATDKIYRDIVLKQNGIWIDNKQSRFICDFNRDIDRAIYQDDTQKWIPKLWKEPLTENQRDHVLESYREFYFTLRRLLDTYRFNIIFDAHSMRHRGSRPMMSFGVEYVPSFYMPIVYAFRKNIHQSGYGKVSINKPFKGGYILKYLSEKFPDVFIFSMEVNKQLYMDTTERYVQKRKLKELSKFLLETFKIDINGPGEQERTDKVQASS